MKRSCHYNFATAAVVFSIFSFCFVTRGGGQAAGQGNVRFVNAAGIPEKVFLTIDTTKLRPEGFSAGDTTGAFGILAGPHQFSVSNPAHGVAQAAVSVQPNSSTTVIAYCKTVIDSRTRQPTQILQLLPRQNPPRAHGKQFQLLYLSSRPTINLTINDQPRSVSALRELMPGDLPSGQIKVEYSGNPVLTFDAPESGNFLVVIFDDLGGKVSGVVVPDYN
jgi:hypothetical protein